MRVQLRLKPVPLRTANEYVRTLHRHHKPVRGCLFCVSVWDELDTLAGVAIAGRPVARTLQDGYTAEVLRCCTNGIPNACSMLYGALWRAARAIGYTRMITYTLPVEGGGSLRAAGWREVGPAGGGSWDRPERPRTDDHPLDIKTRWQVDA